MFVITIIIVAVIITAYGLSLLFLPAAGRMRPRNDLLGNEKAITMACGRG